MKAIGVGLAVVLILVVAGDAMAQGARSTRPGGSGGGGQASGRSSGHSGGSSRSSTAQRPSGSAPTRVSGQASYGYSTGVSGSYPYYPYYPYYGNSFYGYGYGWGWGLYGGYWGSPWYSAGVWWPPAGYYVGMQPERLTVGESRSATPAIVETDIQPRKAAVLLDGEEVGRAKDFNGTWDRLTVPSGGHTLEFSAPGYMTLRTAIRLEPGKYYRISEDLRKGAGIDPRSQTAPPPDEPIADADPGVPVAAGSALQRGLLKIAADPPDAAVYLDGEFLASARELAGLHGAIPVAIGQHEVEVTHPKLKSRSLRVEVTGDDPVHVDLRMGETQ